MTNNLKRLLTDDSSYLAINWDIATDDRLGQQVFLHILNMTDLVDSTGQINGLTPVKINITYEAKSSSC